MTSRVLRRTHREPVIAYLVGTFPGITETFILREIRSLLKRDIQVVVYALRRPEHPQVERSLMSAEMQCVTIYARPDNVHHHLWANMKAFARAPDRYLRALRTFLGELSELKPYDIGRVLYHFFCGIGFIDDFRNRGVRHLHAHFIAGSNMALAANLYDGYTFSFTAHASGDIYRNAFLLREKVRQATVVMPVCEYNRRYLDSVTDFEFSGKLLRIYNDIDVKEWERLEGGSRGYRNSEKERGRVVSVGSLVRMKGHATLIHACKLLEERGYDFVCEIIGEGPERNVLERLIEQSELESRVRVAGAQSLRTVYRALERADVFVLLSEIDTDGYRDGFPTVILEAMAMNLPIVSTWVSGIPEMVESGITGFLVPERDVEGATRVIAKLLEDADLRRSMGSAGRRKLEREFSSDEVGDVRAELLHKIVNS